MFGVGIDLVGAGEGFKNASMLNVCPWCIPECDFDWDTAWGDFSGLPLFEGDLIGVDFIGEVDFTREDCLTLESSDSFLIWFNILNNSLCRESVLISVEAS